MLRIERNDILAVLRAQCLLSYLYLSRVEFVLGQIKIKISCLPEISNKATHLAKKEHLTNIPFLLRLVLSSFHQEAGERWRDE